MVKVTAYKNKLCQYEQRGASILEVILSSAIILIVTPFLYNQIVDTTHTIQDINTANKIISLKDAVINYVRLNQNKWPDVAQIKMDDNDVKSISNLIHTAFIDQYQVMGATVTDVYLAFDLNETELRTVGVAKHIGQEASVVSGDGVAYGETWAVTAPDFKPGDLIYRVSRDFDAEDKLKYLHRGTMGEDNLNTMQRDLYMGYSNIFNVGTIDALFADLRNIQTTFVEADYMEADTIYFSAGANMNAEKVSIGARPSLNLVIPAGTTDKPVTLGQNSNRSDIVLSSSAPSLYPLQSTI